MDLSRLEFNISCSKIDNDELNSHIQTPINELKITNDKILKLEEFRSLKDKTQLIPRFVDGKVTNRQQHCIDVSKLSLHIFSKLVAYKDAYFLSICGLLHDLGHPPFGHAGERALDKIFRMEGGFESNAQTVRLLSELKLTEFIPFLLKHNAIIPHRRPACSGLVKGVYVSCADRLPTNTVSPAINRCIQLLDEIDELAYAISDTRDLHITFGYNYLSHCQKALPEEHFEFIQSVVAIKSADTFAVFLELEPHVNWINTVRAINQANRNFYLSSELSKKEEVIAHSALTRAVESLTKTKNLSPSLKKDFIHKQTETEIFNLIKGNNYEQRVIAC